MCFLKDIAWEREFNQNVPKVASANVYDSRQMINKFIVTRIVDNNTSLGFYTHN